MVSTSTVIWLCLSREVVDFPSFCVFGASFFLGISIPFALYGLLWGSGSSLFKGHVAYVISLSMRGINSSVRTY